MPEHRTRRLLVVVAMATALAGCRAAPLDDALRADVDELVAAFERTHPQPPADLEERAAALRDGRSMDRDRFLVEVMRLTAARDRDGHTGVFPLAQPHVGLWPLQLYDFDDGWRVVAAMAPHDDLVGGHVTAVGGRPVAEAAELVRPLVSHDNAASLRGRLPQYLVMPAVLRGLGMNPTLTVDGHTIAPDVVSADEYAEWRGDFYPLVCPRLEPPSEPWDVRPHRHAVVLRYGLTASGVGDRSITELALELREAVAREDPDRVVVDVRDNPGGNNGSYPPLLSALHDIAEQRPGALRVLVGRCTFSAAANFVAELVAITDATTVGETMGGSPNHWGDARPFTLGASGIVVHVATRWWELGGRDDRVAVEPDVTVPLMWGDTARGVDTTLEAAL